LRRRRDGVNGEKREKTPGTSCRGGEGPTSEKLRARAGGRSVGVGGVERFQEPRGTRGKGGDLGSLLRAIPGGSSVKTKGTGLNDFAKRGGKVPQKKKKNLTTGPE